MLEREYLFDCYQSLVRLYHYEEDFCLALALVYIVFHRRTGEKPYVKQWKVSEPSVEDRKKVRKLFECLKEMKNSGELSVIGMYEGVIEACLVLLDKFEVKLNESTI